MADPEADREEEIVRKRTQAEADRAIAIEELSYANANLRKERQLWCLANKEIKKAKKSGNAERIAK